MSGDHNSKEMRAMRRQFAKLIGENPREFAACVAEYQKKGPHAFDGGSRRRENGVTQMALIFLLAHYRMRPDGMSERKWRVAEADKGVRWGDGFSGGFWTDPETIKKHLAAARTAEKSDPDFAYEVDFTVKVLQEIAASCSTLGKI